MDTKENLRQLLEALEKHGVDKNKREEAVTHILLHKVELIHWRNANRKRVILHAYLLAEAKTLLQDSLATNPNAEGRAIIEQHIQEIDDHFARYQWPTAIAEDDPVLLKALWDQQNIDIAPTHDHGAHEARVPARSERNRILRALLKLPATLSAQGEFEPVITRDLVAALQSQPERAIKAVLVDELQARYPTAYDFLAILYQRRLVTKLDRLLDLKKMSNQGFLESITKSADALIALIDNLTLARNVLGKQNFLKIISSWNQLNQICWVAFQDLHPSGINWGGYQLAYPVEYAESQMPPWMNNSPLDAPQSEHDSDAGTYVLFSASTNDHSSKDKTNSNSRPLEKLTTINVL